jgi:hypothetical protein
MNPDPLFPIQNYFQIRYQIFRDILVRRRLRCMCPRPLPSHPSQKGSKFSSTWQFKHRCYTHWEVQLPYKQLLSYLLITAACFRRKNDRLPGLALKSAVGKRGLRRGEEGSGQWSDVLGWLILGTAKRS